MKAVRLFLLGMLLPGICPGADKTDLAVYLKTHRYAINLADTNTFAMLPALMGSHNVLIHGENASHNLRLYDTLQAALRRQLVRQHLRVALIEHGRSMAHLFIGYLAGDTSVTRLFQPAALVPYRPFRGAAAFRVAGIDFEQAGPFYLAVKHTLRGLNIGSLSETSALIGRVTDSSYAGYSEQQFHAFYKKISASFTAQDAALRRELGDRYEPLRYLCTNPNVTKRYDNRDPAMVRNLTDELTPFDTGVAYYCEIGVAHSRPDERGSMAALLTKDPLLRDRIIVMNTYCDDCRTGKERLSNSRLSCMAGTNLQAFRNAALGSITLYDLSGLTGADAGMQESGTLLLFVQHHD